MYNFTSSTVEAKGPIAVSEQLIPEDIQLHRASRVLSLRYADGRVFELPCEYLRVMSPSAEVKGHGPGQEVLQVGKKYVNISGIEPVGNYALQFSFSDGHSTGIYAWSYLRELGEHQAEYWQRYLDQLAAAGKSREPDSAPVIFFSAAE